MLGADSKVALLSCSSSPNGGPTATMKDYIDLHRLEASVVLQVVSDIDDTLMCSGGNWPAGRDMRYPRKCMYPGALALYSELDIGYCTRLQARASSWYL